MGIYFDLFFVLMSIDMSSMFHKTLSKKVAEFDGCQADKKGQFSKKKIFKNLLLRNRNVDKADTLHACL